MRKPTLRLLGICGSVLIGLAILFYAVYRPWQLTWGATDEEIRRAMPGDGMVVDANFTATRAVTIRASPQQIWPWIVQIGYRRAGFYSYDRLDNDGIPSAEIILPEYQTLAVGDAIPLSSTADAVVEVLEPHRFMMLVYRGHSGAEAPRMTWAWGLYEQDPQRTRLVTRLHVRIDSTLSKLGWDAFEIIMMRKHMFGIQRRAEAYPSRERTGLASAGSSPGGR